MKKKLMLLVSCVCFTVCVAMAQTTKVTGIVISQSDGLPVVGATVVVKGSTSGTITDIDGKFSLNVSESAKTLVVSFIGMKKQEVGIKKGQMKITLLPDERRLDEVVVTAMGISREKKALGYAVQDINSDLLNQASNADLAGSLQGKVAGVQITPSSGMPGASSQIMIRGARSFTGDNSPLYVIDGLPVNSTYDESTFDGVVGADNSNRAIDIDPSDIESIDILKGQAASALYGIRASNGVILITTKSGRGLAKGKPQITFSTSVSFDKISRYPELQTMYAQGSKGIYDPFSSMSWGPKISDLPNDPTYGGNVPNKYNHNDPSGTQGMYYVPQRAAAGLNPWAKPQVYNNVKEFFRTGVTWNNSLNIAQATEKVNYSLSLGSSDQSGIIPTTGMKRYNAKGTAELKLNSNWTTGFSANYVNTSIDKLPTANDGILATVFPAPPSYDLAGIPAHIVNNPYVQNNYRGGSFAAAYWMLDNVNFDEQTSRFYGNAYANYKTKFHTDNHTLNVKYQLGTDAYTTDFENVWGYGSKGSSKNGQIENYGWKSVMLNSLLTISYDWKINSDWSFDALLGNEFIQNNRRRYYEYGDSFNFPGWNHISNATSKNNEINDLTNRTVGFFGSASAAYKNMLYLTVTGRNDYVSNMPTGNRSFFYPSVSAGFVLTELESLKNDIVNFAKIRASYAEVGQAGDYYNNYYYVPTYGSGFYLNTPLLYPINGVNGFNPYYVVFDSKLKPQNTQSYELGFDLNFLDNRIGLSYTYSRQNVKDQIFEVPLAGSTGAQSMLTNGGRIHTNAHEITLSANPIRMKNVNWDFAFNWSKVDNYVDALADGVESIFLGGFATPQVRAGIGDKFPVIYGNSYMRNDKGELIVDSEGLPQIGEAKVIGSVSPDFRLGFNTSLRVYKFTLSAVLDWKQGGHMYGGTKGLLDLYGISKRSGDREGSFIVPGVKENGQPNDIKISGPKGYQAYYEKINDIHESSVYETSFVKLREVALSYQILNKSWLNISVNAFARNILLWSAMPDFDPESSQGNTNMAGAFERFSLPATSSYGLGLTVKF